MKRFLHIILLCGGLLFMLTACHTKYIHLYYKAVPTCYANETETDLAFVLNTSAYRKAKAISRFPDGGRPKYLHRSIGLFMLATDNKQLMKMVSFDDLIFKNFNIPNSLKTEITVLDSFIYYKITPLTDWDTYLKWCDNRTDSAYIISLKEKYQNQYKVSKYDKKIFIVDSVEFNAAFKNKSPYSLAKLNNLLDDIPLQAMGLYLNNIYPRTEEKYIEETIYLKNESAVTRRAVVEQIISKLSKDEIKMLLRKMDDYKNDLDGYDKTSYELYSKETYEQIQALL